MSVPVANDPWQADRNDALAFIVSLGAIAIVLASLAGVPLEPLQLPAGLMVGLFAPGYLLLRATVGGRLKGTLRMVLPIPLTLALAALTGVFVEATPHGVTGNAIGWALCLGSVVLALVVWRRGTYPVTWRPTDMRPSVGDVLRAPVGRRPRSETEPPPLGADLLLTISVLIALAIAGLWIARALDRSADPAPYTALTGRVLTAGEPRNGVTRTQVELTVINDAPRGVRPVLRVGTDPPRPGSRRLEQILDVPAGSARKVAIELSVPCDGAIRAALSDAKGAPAKRAVKLRVACRKT